jgi:hypothetical protein
MRNHFLALPWLWIPCLIIFRIALWPNWDDRDGHRNRADGDERRGAAGRGGHRGRIVGDHRHGLPAWPGGASEGRLRWGAREVVGGRAQAALHKRMTYGPRLESIIKKLNG